MCAPEDVLSDNGKIFEIHIAYVYIQLDDTFLMLCCIWSDVRADSCMYILIQMFL